MPVVNPKDATGQNTLLNQVDSSLNSLNPPAPAPAPIKSTEPAPLSVTPKIETAPTPVAATPSTWTNTVEPNISEPAPTPAVEWTPWEIYLWGIAEPIKLPETPKAAPDAPDITAGKTPEQIKSESIDSIIKSLDPNGSFSPEEKSSLISALGSENPEAYIWALKWNSSILVDKAKWILEAYRNTRDLTLKQDRTNALNERAVSDATRAYDEAMGKQKQRMEADANNMSVVQWTAGRLKSRNMLNAINQVLDNNKNIYTSLAIWKERELQRIAEDLKYETELIGNQYNDAVDEGMQIMLKNIAALDSTGQMNTKMWLMQARSFVQKTLENNFQASTSYYNALSVLDQKYTTLREEKKTQTKYDDNITKQMNDDYLYNASWERMTDSKGNNLKIQKPVGWTPITKEPITLPDGSMAMIYQTTWADWKQTLSTVKVSGTEVADISDDMISWIAKAVSSWAIDSGTLKAMWLSPAQIQKVVSQVTWTGKNNTDYGIVWQHYDENTGTMVNDYGFIDKDNQTTTGGYTGTWNWNSLPSSGWLDFSTNQAVINAHPGVAAFKNNNPTGLTWGISDGLKKMFDWAGISYQLWTARPKKEWGNYIKFASVSDWLAAYQLSLMHPGGKSNVDVYQRLYDWSAGWNRDTPQSTKVANKIKYANDIMAIAGIKKWTKFEQVTPEQMNKLMNAHLTKESPWFIQEITKAGGTGGQQTKTAVEQKARQYIDWNLTDKDIENLPKWVQTQVVNAKAKLLDSGYVWKKARTQLEKISTEAQSLLKHPWLSWGVWVSFQKVLWENRVIPWTDTANFIAKFKSFRDNLVLPNLDKLKGAMSDKDIEFIRNSATPLNLSMSEEEFKTQVKNVVADAQRALGMTPEQTPTPTQTASNKDIMSRIVEMRNKKTANK